MSYSISHTCYTHLYNHYFHSLIDKEIKSLAELSQGEDADAIESAIDKLDNATAIVEEVGGLVLE